MKYEMGAWFDIAKCNTTVTPKEALPDFTASDGPGIQAAKDFCNGFDGPRCPSRAKCLNYAIDNRIDTGVYGGMSARQRKRVLKERLVEQQAKQASVTKPAS